MKVFLLVAGIVLIVACVLSVLFAALNLFGYYNVKDGSNELYARLRSRAAVFFTVGAVTAVIAVVCLVIRIKI